MPKGATPVLSCEGLDVSYGGVRAVRGFTLDVAAGEIVGLVGESGSGKSSVLRAVAGLLGQAGRVSAGSIRFQGGELAGLPAWRMAGLRGARVAYVFQDPTASLDPLFRVGRQFDECLAAHGRATGERAHEVERALLREMGFDEPDRVLAAYPHELSGGMCQRVVLAMSAALEPELLLGDEPTSALDVASQKQVLALLARMRDEHGCSMVVASHNIAALSLVADRIGVMRSGELVELGERAQVLEAPVHPYTVELIAAVPRSGTVSASGAGGAGSAAAPTEAADGACAGPLSGGADDGFAPVRPADAGVA